MAGNTLLYTSTVQRGGDPSKVQVPNAFGFALLSTAITKGMVDFIWLFLNRTDKDVSVEWKSTHPFDVIIEDKDGRKLHLNDYMPKPLPKAPPTIAKAETENYRILHFDPGDAAVWPKLDFKFDPAHAPYKVHVSLNSTTHHVTASAQLEFADVGGKD